MKNIYAFITFAFLGLSGFSQTEKTYQYAKLLDDPNHVADKIVSVHVPVNFGSNTSFSLGAGGDVIWSLSNKLSTFGSFAYSPINGSGFASHDWDLGSVFTLGQKTKVKDVKIVLKWSDRRSSSSSYNTNTGGTTETTTRSTSATYLETKAKYLQQYKVRGGLYGYKGAFEIGVSSPNEALFMTGVFGGFEFSTQAAVLSEVDGKKGVTSGLTRIYADVLLAPIHRVNKVGQGFGFGAKGGFAIYMNPNKAKSKGIYAYQAYNSMFFKAEIGNRPSQGWFFMMGTGLMIFRNR